MAVEGSIRSLQDDKEGVYWFEIVFGWYNQIPPCGRNDKVHTLLVGRGLDFDCVKGRTYGTVVPSSTSFTTKLEPVRRSYPGMPNGTMAYDKKGGRRATHVAPLEPFSHIGCCYKHDAPLGRALPDDSLILMAVWYMLLALRSHGSELNRLRVEMRILSRLTKRKVPLASEKAKA